jgi:hypothetical protein
MHESSPQPSAKPPWLPRFGLAELMLSMLIFCVMGAAGSYLMRVREGNGRAVFVIFTLAAPIALVLVLSTYRGLRRWLARRSW